MYLMFRDFGPRYAVGSDESKTPKQRNARARVVFGAFSDSQFDVSENHDKYLPEAFQS